METTTTQPDIDWRTARLVLRLAHHKLLSHPNPYAFLMRAKVRSALVDVQRQWLAADTRATIELAEAVLRGER